MPILSNHGVRECCKGIKADYLMERNPDVFRAVETIQNIKKIFADPDQNHHAFPIVNKKGVLIGIMPRNHIINILKQKNFYHPHEEEYKSELSAEQQEIMKAYREKNKTDALATKGQWKHKENLESQNIKDIVKSLKDLHED
jgi:predicted transcriptional regulator|tara:strand:+ start:2204 stop:2629 length:426 start_codon:yes stop_codon:yes gene_type:complete